MPRRRRVLAPAQPQPNNRLQPAQTPSSPRSAVGRPAVALQQQQFETMPHAQGGTVAQQTLAPQFGPEWSQPAQAVHPLLADIAKAVDARPAPQPAASAADLADRLRAAREGTQPHMEFGGKRYPINTKWTTLRPADEKWLSPPSRRPPRRRQR